MEPIGSYLVNDSARCSALFAQARAALDDDHAAGSMLRGPLWQCDRRPLAELERHEGHRGAGSMMRAVRERQPAPGGAVADTRGAAVKPRLHTMTCVTTDAVVARCLTSAPDGACTLVLQVVSEVALPGGRVWLAKLSQLMAPFGIAEPLVRTSVFRLTRQGALQAVREGRVSAYGIGAQPVPARLAAPWRSDWTLVMGCAGQLDSRATAALHKRLRDDGYRLLVSGVPARPGNPAATMAPVVRQLGRQRELWVCYVTELAAVSQRRQADLAAAAWHLSASSTHYRRLLERFTPALVRARAGACLMPHQAFVLRTLLRSACLSAQKHDPQMPVAQLPRQWHGAPAAILYRDLCALTADGASLHLDQILGAGGAPGRAAKP